MGGWNLQLIAVVAIQMRKLIRIGRLHYPLPGIDLVGIDADNGGDGMQVQVAANVWVLKSRTQEYRRRVNRACCYDYGFGMNGHAVGITGLRIRHGGFNAYRSPILDEHLVSVTTHDDARAVLVGILHIGLQGGLLAPVAAAKTTETAALLTAYGVAAQDARVIPKSGRTIQQQAILCVMLAVFCVDADTLLYGGEAILQLRACEAALQTGPLIPFREYFFRSAERGCPVDNRATAQGATYKHNHTQVFRRQCASLQEKFGGCLRFLPGKVSLIVITTLLQHNHTLASLSKFTGDDSASSARADNDHISL